MKLGPLALPDPQAPGSSLREWSVPARLKQGFVLFALLALAALSVVMVRDHWTSAFDRARAQLEADDLEGESALPFVLPTRGGGTLLLSQLHGKPVLVNFWASWCAPCREEEPSLNSLAERYDPASFEVVAVSVDDDWDAVGAFFGKRTPAYRVALDEGGKISNAYGTNKFPESYLVDASGELKLKFIGPRNWVDPSVFAAVEALGAKAR